MQLNNIDTLLWDWNGTLLNDVNHCIRSMNIMLKNRNLPLLDKERYLKVFTFPVKKYYAALGFDFEKEAFEIPAEEFIIHYNKDFSKVPLYEDVASTLRFFHEKKRNQYIVSAMKHDALLQSVKERKIEQYFTQINGIADNLAYGKTANAIKLIQNENLDPQKTLLVGDTLHDAEVAKDIGVHNILIARGHQNADRLKKTGNPVVGSLNELLLFLGVSEWGKNG